MRAVGTFHHQAALLVHIPGDARAAVKLHRAAQIHTGCLIALPEGGKALGLVGVQRPVKAEIRHVLGQPFRVGVQVHRHALQGKAGAVGQSGGGKILLRLGQIDANARQKAAAVRRALAEDAHQLFAVQQQVVGPFDLAIHVVALF